MEEIHEVPGACYKRFRTQEQAEAFIEDWKEAYAEIWRRAVKEGLDKGLRPQDMKLNTQEILRGASRVLDMEEMSRRFDSVISLE